MKHHDFDDLELFITGPISIRQEVREAGLLPEFGHRDSENDKRFKPIREHLRSIAGVDDDYELLIVNGSGSTAMEMAIRSLAAGDDTILNVSVGAFGDLFHKLAVVNGKNAVQLKFEYGETYDIEHLKSELARIKPAVVSLTQNETSTGVKNDIAAACEAVREAGALPLVDGVSIFGGCDVGINEARPAMYLTSTQKALGLPAGFGLAFVHKEAFAKAENVENRGYASDILAQRGKAVKNQTLTTPNCTLANQMFVQLTYIVEEEGIASRFARHEQLRDMTAAFVGRLPGYDFFAPDGYRSPTMTCIQTPEGVTFEDLKALKERMRTKGYLFDPGYANLNKALEQAGRPPVFRIGHMGDMQPASLDKYLARLEPELP